MNAGTDFGACYGLIIPGCWQAPTDPTTLSILNSSEAVKEWELSNSDVVYGGDYGSVEANSRVDAIGYMYTQAIDYDSTNYTASLRNIADAMGLDYEDVFLHFKEDTTFQISDPIDSIWTSLYAIPEIVGWTQSPQHTGFWLWQRHPWDEYNHQPFQNWQNDGKVFVFHNEIFTGLDFRISSNNDTNLSIYVNKMQIKLSFTLNIRIKLMQ
eukprot:130462_1